MSDLKLMETVIQLSENLDNLTLVVSDLQSEIAALSKETHKHKEYAKDRHDHPVKQHKHIEYAPRHNHSEFAKGNHTHPMQEHNHPLPEHQHSEYSKGDHKHNYADKSHEHKDYAKEKHEHSEYAHQSKLDRLAERLVQIDTILDFLKEEIGNIETHEQPDTREWVFDMKRGQFGVLDKITAKRTK